MKHLKDLCEEFLEKRIPPAGCLMSTGFPSIDEMVRPNCEYGLTITGNARYEILVQLMDRWATEKIGIWKLEEGWDEIPGEPVLVVDLGASNPPKGTIERLWAQTRGRRFLVIVGDNQISDPLFDRASAGTLHFDWAPENKKIWWKITCARNGHRIGGELHAKLGQTPKWNEATDRTVSSRTAMKLIWRFVADWVSKKPQDSQKQA